MIMFIKSYFFVVEDYRHAKIRKIDILQKIQSRLRKWIYSQRRGAKCIIKMARLVFENYDQEFNEESGYKRKRGYG